MPRTSSRTGGESRERSTTVAGSVVLDLPETWRETIRSCRDLPDRALSSVSTTAARGAHRPAPTRVRAGLCGSLLRASVRPGRSQSRRAVEAETIPGIVQTLGGVAADLEIVVDERCAHTS